MTKITFTNTTTNKTESKDLNEEQVLSEIRKQLGDFMKAEDVFVEAAVIRPVDESKKTCC